MSVSSVVPPVLLLTRDEAAAATKLCARSIDALIRSGDLKAVRIGRRVLISVDAIKDWITRQEAATGGEQ